jgi:hypothetical protein
MRALTAGCAPRGQEKAFLTGSLALGLMYRLGAVLMDIACDQLKSAANARLQALWEASHGTQRATAAGAGRPPGTASLQPKEITR